MRPQEFAEWFGVRIGRRAATALGLGAIALTALSGCTADPPLAPDTANRCVDFDGYIHRIAEVRTYSNAIAVHGDYVYSAGGSFDVVNITDPARPQITGGLPLYYQAYGVALDWPYAYVANADAGLRVMTVVDPTAPGIVGTVDTPGTALGVDIGDGYAFIADGVAGLQVVDISNPADPRIVGGVDTPGAASNVVVIGDYAYVADESGGVQLVSVSTPQAPAIVGRIASPELSLVHDIALHKGHAFLAGGDGLRVLDVQDPGRPRVVPTAGCMSEVFSLTMAGDWIYGTTSRGMEMADVSNPTSPRFLGTMDMPAPSHEVAVAGTYAYVADSSAGVQVVDVTNPGAPPVLGSVDTGHRLVAAAMVSSYLLLGAEGGVEVVDVAGNSPIVIGDMNLPATCREVVVDGSYAYAACDGYGIQVINASIPSSPRFEGSVDTRSSTGGVAVAGGRVYAASDEGLHVIDVSNPRSPVLVGAVTLPEGGRGVAIHGYHAVVVGPSSLEVVDVSDPSSPHHVGTLFFGGGDARSVAIAGRYAYVAAGYLGLKVVDISNATAPSLVRTVDLPGSSQRVRIIDGRAYVMGSQGLDVLDVSNPAVPRHLLNAPTADSHDAVITDDGLYLTDESRLMVLSAPCGGGSF